jgi:hypothetical protein
MEKYKPLQRATVDGSITVRIYSDPELVVAATPPTAPQNVLVVGPGRGSSTVSWLAPTSTGGSPITGYDVFLDNVLACSTVTVLTCDLTNLSDSNTYNVKVKAKNAVGNGTEATTSFTTEAPPSSGSGSGGGSAPGPVPPAKPVDPPKPAPPVKPVAPAPVAQLQHLLHPLPQLRQLHLQHLVTQALRHQTQEQIQALTQLVTTLHLFHSIRFPHLKVLLL